MSGLSANGVRLATSGGTAKTPNSLNPLRETLTATLVTKMREKFSGMAKDVKSQDLIASEVGRFMSSVASLKESDIVQLEEKIRLRLGGTATRESFAKHRTDDEWTLLMKFQNDKSQTAEERKRLAAIAQRKAMQDVLDKQMKELEERKRQEVEEQLRYAEEALQDVARWKNEEAAKVARRAAAAEKLKSDRELQLAEQTARAERDRLRRLREEMEEEDRVQAEQRAKMVKDAETKAKMAAEMAEINRMNDAFKAKREDDKHKAIEEDLAYQRKFTERLEAQDAARKAQLTKLKEKQEMLRTQLERFNASAKEKELAKGSRMRFMPDALIERNHAEYERKAVAEDERRKKAALDRTSEMKRVLAVQLQEREARRQAAVEERIMTRTLNTKELVAFEAELVAKRESERLKKLSIKDNLEAQMRANAAAIKNLSMTETERKINRDLLAEANLL